MIKKFKKWLEHRRYTRRITRVVVYVIKNGMESAMAGAVTGDTYLFKHYRDGLKLLVELSNREWEEYHRTWTEKRKQPRETQYGYNAASGMTYPTDPEESWKSAIDPFGPR